MIRPYPLPPPHTYPHIHQVKEDLNFMKCKYCDKFVLCYMCTYYCIVENKVPKHKTRKKIAEHYELFKKESSAHQREQAHKRSSSCINDEANAKASSQSKRKQGPAKPRNTRTRSLENKKNLSAPRVVNQGC